MYWWFCLCWWDFVAETLPKIFCLFAGAPNTLHIFFKGEACKPVSKTLCWIYAAIPAWHNHAMAIVRGWDYLFDDQWATVITANFHLYMCVNFCEPYIHDRTWPASQDDSSWHVHNGQNSESMCVCVCVCVLVQVCVGVHVSVCALLPPLSTNTCKLSACAGWIWAIVLAGRVVFIKTALCQPSPRNALPLQLLIAPAPTLPPNKFTVTLPAIWPWIGSK